MLWGLRLLSDKCRTHKMIYERHTEYFWDIRVWAYAMSDMQRWLMSCTWWVRRYDSRNARWARRRRDDALRLSRQGAIHIDKPTNFIIIQHAALCPEEMIMKWTLRVRERDTRKTIVFDSQVIIKHLSLRLSVWIWRPYGKIWAAVVAALVKYDNAVDLIID